MQLQPVLASAFVLLVGVAVATAALPAHSTKVCFTAQVATKPLTRPHTYCSSTTTTHCVDHTTVDKTVTVTPKAFTTTVSSTATVTATAPSTTDTATTTTTVTTTTAVSTITSTETDTETTTVQSATSTSTVPADATFVPVSDTIPGSANQQSGSTAKTRKAKRSHNVAASHGLLLDRDSKKKPLYPGDVQCYEYWGKCSTSTSTHTCTRTAAKLTATKTATVTTTVTTTPGAVSTTTVTALSSVSGVTSSTTTTTTTTSSFDYVSTTTVYAACATANNLAYYINNNGISTIDAPSDEEASFAVSQPGSAQACCVASLLNPLGAVWYWYAPLSKCIVVSAKTTCAAGLTIVDANPLHYNGSPSLYAIGNSNCGHWTPYVPQPFV